MSRTKRGRRNVTLLVSYGLIALFMIFFLFPPYWKIGRAHV